jgi:hypothetical protein
VCVRERKRERQREREREREEFLKASMQDYVYFFWLKRGVMFFAGERD